MKRLLLPFMLVATLLLSSRLPLFAQGGGTYAIPWYTVDSGGGSVSGGIYSLRGTTGQHDASPDSASGGSYTVRGGFWYSALAPLAVEMESFEAECRASEEDILLTWVTASETDNLGFNLWRAASATGTQSQLNTELIPSQSPGGGQGAAYEYADATAAPEGTFFYWLESVDLGGGSSRYGPVQAQLPCVPTAVTLATLAATSGVPWRAAFALALLLATLLLFGRVRKRHA